LVQTFWRIHFHFSSNYHTIDAFNEYSTTMDLSVQMFKDIPKVVHYHWKEGNINWPMGIYITLVHVLGVIGAVCYVKKCSAETLLWAWYMFPMSGIGITCGAHRLWAHRSYEAHIIFRIYLMLLQSISNEGSIFHWSRDHRVHHKYSETNADPHNATRGFFFAHMGWLFVKKHPDVVKAGREIDLSDLFEDPVVMFQKKLDPFLQLYMCFIWPAQMANWLWGENFWNALFVAGFMRYMIVLHFTWLVNSAAHLYGDHPYDTESYPAENPFVALCSGGEGWHNWHHKYPYDYAAAEMDYWAQFNPGKWCIDVAYAMGLAYNRKRATAAWAMGRARRDKERAEGIPLKRAPQRPWEVNQKAKSQ
jgi:stearoyl-CoA desaturase (Delta-9 desaturase)